MAVNAKTKLAVEVFKEEMLTRLEQNKHRDAHGDWGDWVSSDFHDRAHKNLTEGLHQLSLGNFDEASKCFADVGNLSMMLHSQAKSGNYINTKGHNIHEKK